MKNFMIIEDDPYFTEVLEAIFESDGNKYFTFQKALDAYEKLNEVELYDGIVLDLMMPKDGILKELKPEITAGEKIYNEIRLININIPIAVITAKEKRRIPNNILSDINVLVLLKPIDEEDINKMISFFRSIS